MIKLYIQAPFGRVGKFTSDNYWPTHEFITPSTAYGFAMRLCNIEIEDNQSLDFKKNLPKLKLAIGMKEFPVKQVSYHHKYKACGKKLNIGDDGRCIKCSKKSFFGKGNKRVQCVSPVKKEFLSNIKLYLLIDGDEVVENTIIKCLNGELESIFNNTPYIGDNNFTIDIIKKVDNIEDCYWWYPIEDFDDFPEIGKKIDQMTITINRKESHKTVSKWFTITDKQKEVPESSWVEVGY